MTKNSLNIVVIGLLVAGALFFFFLFRPQVSLERSILGSFGLSVGFEEHEIETVVSTYNSVVLRDEFGATILPILDTNLTQWSNSDEVNEDNKILPSTTLRDIPIHNFKHKVSLLPAVVVLPKWNEEALVRRALHMGSIIPIEHYNVSYIFQLKLSAAQIERGEFDFFEFSAFDKEGALFAPQVFVKDTLPKGCESVLEIEIGILAARCEMKSLDHPILYISDPDLLNNHGLGVAQNKAIFADILKQFIKDEASQKVYVDYFSRQTLFVDEFAEERQEYDRASDSFVSMFRYPFSILWALVFLIFGMLYWRGAFRFGAPIRTRAKIENVSSQNATAAMAKILRLSGKNNRLASDFVQGHVARVTKRVLGEAALSSGPDALFDYLRRQEHPEVENYIRLAREIIDIKGEQTEVTVAKKLENYKELAKKVINPHEFR